MSAIKYQGKPIKAAIGEQHRVELPPRVFRVRLAGLLFENDKTFLLPTAMKGVRVLVDFYEQHPDMDVVVTGHTDRLGTPAYNLGLSAERAQAIACFLRDDVDDWLARFQKHPCSSPWGTREDQHMLSAILDDTTGDFFYRGPIHGALDATTQAAVKRFQRSRGLVEDGVPGPKTRRETITSYMRLDGTTLPPTANIALLGCGENHNDVANADGTAEPKNRRAEVFLFDPGPPDPAVPSRCPGAGCAYEKWRARMVETVDVDHELCELLVEVVRSTGKKERVAGAEVRLIGIVNRSETTDDNGVAWFRALQPGRYQLTVEKDDYTRVTRDVNVRANNGDVGGDNGNQHNLYGDGDGSDGSGLVHIELDPDSFRVLLREPDDIELFATERPSDWNGDAAVIEMSNSGKRLLVPADREGRIRTARDFNKEAKLLRAQRIGPHREVIDWRLLDDDRTLEPGVERTFDISARLRISAWLFACPFVNADFTIKQDLIDQLKTIGVDDVSLVYTLTWATRDKPREGPAKKPVWHQSFAVAGSDPRMKEKIDPDTGLPSSETPAVTYLKALRAALQPEIRLQLGFEMVKHAADEQECDFVAWLRSATPDEMLDYAKTMRAFFTDRGFDADGIGYDFELVSLKPSDADAMGRLYVATSEAFADNNGLITYANGSFTAEGEYDTQPGMSWVASMPYRLAKLGPNIVARPMMYDFNKVHGVGRTSDTIEFAYSPNASAGIHPSQLQVGIDIMNDAQLKQMCTDVLRRNRAGLCAARIGKRDETKKFPDMGDQAYLARLKLCADALNGDEAPAGAIGMPLQVPNK